jgi:hypothetical protein
MSKTNSPKTQSRGKTGWEHRAFPLLLHGQQSKKHVPKNSTALPANHTGIRLPLKKRLEAQHHPLLNLKNRLKETFFGVDLSLYQNYTLPLPT